jgi:hypothetical protein
MKNDPKSSAYYSNYELGNGMYLLHGEIRAHRLHTEDELNSIRNDLLKQLSKIDKRSKDE